MCLPGENQQDLADIFNGFGSGRRIISSGTLCTSENAGAGENGSFLADPVPCVLSQGEPVIECVWALSAFSFLSFEPEFTRF
jgi:hypothetical protein